MKELLLPMKELYPIIEQTMSDGGEAYVTVRGGSMSPFLQDGRDQAVFASLGDRQIKKGDIVLYQRKGGQFVMHRVYDVGRNGIMTLIGDAQWTLEKDVRPEQLRAFVPRVVRKGREISCEGGFWHWLMTAYQMRIRHPRMARLALRAAKLPFGLKRRIKVWIEHKVNT